MKLKASIYSISILGLLLFFVTACYQAPDFYTYEYPEFAKDIGPANENVADNIIFKGGRSFIYNYQFLDSLGEEQKFISFYNFGTSDRLDWKYMPVPVEETISSEYPIEKIRLKVLRNTANSIEADQQSMIVYELFNEEGTIIPETELSGLTEDSLKVFLFPPRNNGFALIQLTPFPQVEYPLEVGKTWIDNLTVSLDWSDAMKINFESILYLYSNYTITGKKDIETPFGRRSVWVVEGKAESRMGDTSSSFYFDEEYGFLHMEFRFLNGSQLRLEMEKMEEN